jgi:riboflavin-specific deaminase-like protein
MTRREAIKKNAPNCPSSRAGSAAVRPWVLINMAMTADGKIATANRVIESFGSERDQRRLYTLRASADAILCGAGTVRGAGITLGNGGANFERRRRRQGLASAPLRVVVSGAATLPPDADVFRSEGGPVLVLVSRSAPAAKVRALREVAEEVWVGGRKSVDLGAALAWLAGQWNVRRLVCEGGGELNAAMLAAGLVDEIFLTVCPRIFGGAQAPTIAEGTGVSRLADASRWTIAEARQVGDEMFLRCLARQ